MIIDAAVDDHKGLFEDSRDFAVWTPGSSLVATTLTPMSTASSRASARAARPRSPQAMSPQPLHPSEGPVNHRREARHMGVRGRNQPPPRCARDRPSPTCADHTARWRAARGLLLVRVLLSPGRATHGFRTWRPRASSPRWTLGESDRHATTGSSWWRDVGRALGVHQAQRRAGVLGRLRGDEARRGIASSSGPRRA
jgi:hypothetical protein